MKSSIFALLAAAPVWGQIEDPCAHEKYDTVGDPQSLSDGQTVYREIRTNQTHLYLYRNYDTSLMNQEDKYRKVIFQLEPCRGVVYLFVRKTRRCYPNPYSCISLGNQGERKDECDWTHFRSDIDGSKDGAPTIFEVQLSSTQYFISIFGTEKTNAYTFTVLADIGKMPRPGNYGKLDAQQSGELSVQLSWQAAYQYPMGIAQTSHYWIYSSLLLDSDEGTNKAVFLTPQKIFNTVCGLQNNTGKAYDVIEDNPENCPDTVCRIQITKINEKKRYAFNVVAESNQGFYRSYAGLILSTDWQISTQAADDSTLKVVAAIAGSVLVISITGYIWLIKLYAS